MIISRKRVIDLFCRAFLVVLFSQLGACELNLGGPRAAAALYVKNMVEKPNDSQAVQEDYAKLPNRVVIDYARALYQQGVKLDYETEKVGTTMDSTAQVVVTIVPKRGGSVVRERSHSLQLTLRNIPKQGWVVTGFKASP